MTRNVLLANIGQQLQIVRGPTVAISNVAYSFTFTAIGGYPSYTFSIVPAISYSFPPGISASGATLSGTTNGQFSVLLVVTVTDSQRNSVSQTFDFEVINPDPPFLITEASNLIITEDSIFIDV